MKSDGFSFNQIISKYSDDLHLRVHHQLMPQPFNLPKDSEVHLVHRKNPVRAVRGGPSMYTSSRPQEQEPKNQANNKGSALVVLHHDMTLY